MKYTNVKFTFKTTKARQIHKGHLPNSWWNLLHSWWSRPCHLVSGPSAGGSRNRRGRSAAAGPTAQWWHSQPNLVHLQNTAWTQTETQHGMLSRLQKDQTQSLHLTKDHNGIQSSLFLSLLIWVNLSWHTLRWTHVCPLGCSRRTAWHSRADGTPCTRPHAWHRCWVEVHAKRCLEESCGCVWG